MNKLGAFLKQMVKVIIWIAFSFVLLFIILFALIQFPSVQNKIVQFATSLISERTHTKVTISHINISFPKSLIVKGLYLEDLQQDTLLYIGEAKVQIALTKLFFNQVDINQVELGNGFIQVKRAAVDSIFNFNFLLTAFSDSTRKEDVPRDSLSVWTFNLNRLVLKDIRINYEDSISKQSVYAGINHFEIQVRSVDLPKKTFSLDRVYLEIKEVLEINHKNYKNITISANDLILDPKSIVGKNLEIQAGTITFLKTDFDVTGYSDIRTAHFSFPDLTFSSGKSDIELMADSFIPANIELPDSIHLQTVFNGSLESFETKISIKSSFGDAKLFVLMDENENFSGTADIIQFDVGRLLRNTSMFGPVSLTADVDGNGLNPNTLKAKVNARISQLYLNSYNYHNLSLDGNIKNRVFDGEINLNDKNAVLNVAGLLNFNPDHESYSFLLNLEGADLQKLGLTKDDIRIGLVMTADIKGGNLKQMSGDGSISNIAMAYQEKKIRIDSMTFVLVNEGDNNELIVRSDIMDLDYAGTISPFELVDELNAFINNYIPLSNGNHILMNRPSSKFNFKIQLYNHPMLSQVFLPGLTEFEPGIIEGAFDSGTSDLKINATIKKAVYGTTEIKDFVLAVNSDPTTINYKISSGAVSYDFARIENLLLDGKITDETIFAGLTSLDENQNKKLSINAQITKEKDNYKVSFDSKELFLMKKRWNIAPENYIKIGKEGFIVHHFFINSAESQVNITSVNDLFNDDLSITVKDFKLEDISRILEQDTSLVTGIVNGNVLLKRVNNAYGIIADARIDTLVVLEIPVGDLSIKADNPTAGRFDVDVKLAGGGNYMTANGYIIPKGDNTSISMKAIVQSLSMKTVEAFSMGQISESAGTLSGNFLIQGTTASPEITGELSFNDAFAKPAFLNNRLEIVNETIRFKTDGIYFDSFTLLDTEKNEATINGSVKMKAFKDYNFALQINSEDFLLFDTSAKDNEVFYGRMVIDSRIDVSGPISFPVVNGRMKMKKGSNFTFAIPDEKLTTDKGENVVVFIDTLKFNPILDKEFRKVSNISGLKGFDLNSVIEIDKLATLRLLLDPASTDMLVVNGEGALSFTIDRSGKMSLTGAYNLEEGSYMVSLESIIKRRFDINPGSTIIWNGDPLDASISINATYSVRASPYDLVADQMSALSDMERGGYKQRYPFLVQLKLRGELLHPEISFEIKLPPEHQGILGGAVNQKLIMLNEDLSALNKQVFALLVLGRFIQENPLQTESGGTTALVRTTVSKFLSEQLNQLSAKVIPGVEINFDVQFYDDYQTGQAEGRTQVNIGIKKQLFNERLSIQLGGSLDMEGMKEQQNLATDITSDVIIEYKLKKDGRFRLRGFRQNQYEGAIEGQLIETGVGIVYVRDFKKWQDFFNRQRSKVDTLKIENNDPINIK